MTIIGCCRRNLRGNGHCRKRGAVVWTGRLQRGAACIIVIAMPSISKPLARIFLPMMLVVFAVPFFTLLFYSVPASDDFCKASLSFDGVSHPGIFGVTRARYTQWSARWLTSVIQSLLMSHVDLVTLYGWLLLVPVTITLISLWYFTRAFFDLSRTQALMVAGVFYAAWVAGMREPREALFWLTGATEYYLPLSALLVLLSLMHRFRPTAWHYASVGLISFAIPALHEIAGTFLCVVALTGVVATRVLKLPGRQWVLSLAMAAPSLAAVLLSPGNALRGARELRHSWDFVQTPYWIAHSFYYGLTWLSTPAVLAATFAIVVLIHCGPQASPPHGRPPRWLAAASLCFMVFILCECTLVEIATGDRLGARVVNWFMFVLWLLFICLVLSGVREIHNVEFSSNTKIGAFVLLAITLFGSSSFRGAAKDLLGPAQAWRRAYVSQFAQRGESLTFLPVPDAPYMAMDQNLAQDPGCWTNRCLANYLGANTVVATGAANACPVAVPKPPVSGRRQFWQ